MKGLELLSGELDTEFFLVCSILIVCSAEAVTYAAVHSRPFLEF